MINICTVTVCQPFRNELWCVQHKHLAKEFHHEKITITLLAACTLLVGCGKKEEPEVIASQEAVAPVEAAEKKEAAAATTEAGDMANSLAAEVQQQTAALVDEAKAAAMKAATSVDWANISWNDVSKVPFSDKDKLIDWASPQINALRDQLAKAAVQQGQLSLANMGDSGWQGTVKNIISALEGVKRASPETWESARGALMIAWEALKQEAAKVLGEG